MKRYIVIGNGTAAVGCIEGIRSTDSEGAITVISQENRPVYCRPLISYFLEDKTTEQKMLYRAPSFYTDYSVSVLYGESAVKIDGAGKTVTTSSGKTLPYDKLCLACGSTPFLPPMENIESVEKRFSFMTMDDAVALKEAVTPQSRVLIVGAGLIGLKCAEGLYAITKNIAVCDLADHILSSILDFDDAKDMQDSLEARGITFSLGTSVARFEGNTAIMKNGEEIPFDILVTAVGVRATIGIFKEAGGSCGRGITVDQTMATSLPDVFAAGDCTESLDAADGKVKIMALMLNAYFQGYCAGVNMAGGDRSIDDAVPMNSIGFFGLHLMSAGTRVGEEKTVVTAKGRKRFYFSDGKLVGFVLIGDVGCAGIYTNIIKKRIPVSELVGFDLEKEPTLSVYGTEKRKKTVESVV